MTELLRKKVPVWLGLVACLLTLFLCTVAFGAPYDVRIVHPTKYSDGTPLPLSAIKHTNIYCGTSATEFKSKGWQTINGNAPTGTIELAGPTWCAATTLAEVTGVGLRESDFGVPVLLDPKRPGAAGLGPSGAQPTICTAGQICPPP